VTAYAVSAEKREELRSKIAAQYGEELELIAPKKESQKKSKSRGRRKKRSGKSR